MNSRRRLSRSLFTNRDDRVLRGLRSSGTHELQVSSWAGSPAIESRSSDRAALQAYHEGGFSRRAQRIINRAISLNGDSKLIKESRLCAATDARPGDRADANLRGTISNPTKQSQ